MPLKKKATWTPEHAAKLQAGFRDHNWDPDVKDGKEINKIIKSVPEIFAVLKPFFSESEGGTRRTNN
jgi:hypothetical protein